MMAAKIILTPEQEIWLAKHYKNTKNAELAARLGISWRSVVRLARERGLKKTPQFMRKCQAATAAAAKDSHLENGTYPPKGYRIPRSEEFQFKQGGKPWDRCGRKKWNEAIQRGAEKRRQTLREERARVGFGLEQRTKLRVIAIPQQKRLDRCYLKARGYILDETTCVAWWTPDTRRAARMEARPRRYYEFKQLPGLGAIMKVNEIISALEEIKNNEPRRFHNALGFGDDGVDILHPFVSGSYELGLVAGALWAFNLLGMDTSQKQLRKFLPGESVLHDGKKAEVVDTYASGAILIRIGSRTYKSVLPGEIQLCGPDGDEPRGSEVRFG